MKITEAQKIEAAKAAFQFQAAHTRKQTKAVLLVAFTLVVIFILPRFISSPFGGIVSMVGSAISLTIYFSLFPESFRSRSDSLTPAICLVAVMWVAAAVGSALLLIGRY